MADNIPYHHIGDLQRAMAEMAELHRKKQDEEAAAKVLEIEAKLISLQFDKAATYTNVFVIGGYAAFWGLWAATKTLILPTQALIAALLMLMSITAFVFFEIYKQHHMSAQLWQRRNILRDPANRTSAQAYMAALKRFESETEQYNVGFLKYWRFSSYVSIGAGLAAVAVLGTSFVWQLI
jgi:hypothetical protein